MLLDEPVGQLEKPLGILPQLPMLAIDVVEGDLVGHYGGHLFVADADAVASAPPLVGTIIYQMNWPNFLIFSSTSFSTSGCS